MPIILLTPLALLGLALLVPLTLLHLRRRRPRYEVASILLWRQLIEGAPPTTSGARLASLPLLLLQALALALLLLGLARPAVQASHTASTQPTRYHAFVLDDSLRMTATDLHPDRLAVAKELIMRQAADDPAQTVIMVVVATAQPYLLVSSTDRSHVRHALEHLAPRSASTDLTDALRLADGLLPREPGSQRAITLLRARGSTRPDVSAAVLRFSSIELGVSTYNQAIVRFSARCATEDGHGCTALALIRNESDRQVTDPVVLSGDGDPLARQSLVLPARSETGLAFRVPEGRHVLELRLTRSDILPLDNAAWCVVAAPQRTHVTLVGEPARIAPIRKALLSLSNVDLSTSRRYEAREARRSDVVILDGQLPSGNVPATPAAILVDPPSIPGGRALGPLRDTVVSGVDASSPLLSDVDLASLDVPSGTAERLQPPDWMAPVIWSASGPLLAAGGMEQHVAVLAFDPVRSNLPQISAFPLLLRNLLRWAENSSPESISVGSDILLTVPPEATRVKIVGPDSRSVSSLLGAAGPPPDPLTFTASQPGIYTITERGPWGVRTMHLAANTFAAAHEYSGPPSEAGGARTSSAPGLSTGPIPWWPWTGVAALVAMATEWLFLIVSRRG